MKAHTHVSVHAPSPGKFRSSQIASDAIWDRIVNSCDITIITIPNFMISFSKKWPGEWPTDSVTSGICNDYKEP